MPHPLTPTAAAHKARLMDEALAADAKLDRLIDLIGQHRTARLKEARQEGTLKTSGLRDRLETEYHILGMIEDVFGIDADDARNDCVSMALDECDYDIKESAFLNDVPVENFGMSHPDAGRGFRVGGAA